MIKLHTLSCVASILLLTSCATFVPNGKGDVVLSRAQSPDITSTHNDLISLPEPIGQITAAVYEFRDKTGQYRPSPANGLSTSVTQGADTILMKSLLDSRWFIPVERASLQNLLTERKITQSASANASNTAAEELSPVSPAQIIFQGTIVSYDSNTHTGGSGARLLGLGASQSFREDRVTVNLRLIDIDDGRVLHSVSSSKRIFSRQLNSGLFSYVDADKILEIEAGNSYNEPSHVAITEAIESALIHIVGEGVVRNTWQLADAQQLDNPIFKRFLSKKDIDKFVGTEIAKAEQIEETKKLVNKVRVRMLRGQKAVQDHWNSLAEERVKRNRHYAKLRRIKLNKEKLANATNKQDKHSEQSSKIRDIAAATAVNTDAQAAQQAISPNDAEQAIARQAQAILNAQAKIQIQATQQAHQAALYAQKLILQKQAQQKQVQQKQTQQIQQGQGPIRLEPVTTDKQSSLQPTQNNNQLLSANNNQNNQEKSND